MKTRLSRVLFLVFLGLLPLSGFGSILNLHSQLEPKDLDWSRVYGTYKAIVSNNIMLGLTQVDQTMNANPALAERWATSDDGKVYTFYLKSGWKWSDGAELTAQHFVDGWLRALNPNEKNDDAHFLYFIQGAEEYNKGSQKTSNQVGIKAIDRTTLQVKLKYPISFFPLVVTHPIYFPQRLDVIKRPDFRWDDVSKIVCLGFYKPVSWKKGSEIALVKNPLVSVANPGPDEVKIHFEKDREKALLSFTQGKIDVLDNVTGSEILRAKLQGASYRIVSQSQFKTYFLGFSSKSEKLKDINIRRAIAQSIDKKRLVEVLDRNLSVAYSLIPNGMPGALSEEILPFDLSKGKAQLSQSTDKAKVMQGLRFGTGNPINYEVGVVVASQLDQNLGIKVFSDLVETSYINKFLAEGRYDLIVGFWSSDYPHASNFLSAFRSGAKTNTLQYASKNFDHYLDLGMQTRNEEDSIEHFKVAQKILIHDEMALVPLFFMNQKSMLSAKIKNLYRTPDDIIYLNRSDVQ